MIIERQINLEDTTILKVYWQTTALQKIKLTELKDRQIHTYSGDFNIPFLESEVVIESVTLIESAKIFIMN